jgi:hypothetical protein
VAEGYGLSAVDLLDYRVLATFLESVGDAVSELSRKLQAGQISKPLAREYSACVSKLMTMNDLATQAFISRRAGRPQTINKQVNALSVDITRGLAAIAKLPTGDGGSTAETIASLERVSKLLVDVSDLAVITQQVA